MTRRDERHCTAAIPISKDQVLMITVDTVSIEVEMEAPPSSPPNGKAPVDGSDPADRPEIGFRLRKN
ncbi:MULTISPECIES: hypothetical protein [Acidobacterium]|uniref:Uncharacterized protein n=1 Tax=Acidobacterium capsulatum (strain ATCC 51196 / DSM 11244 / BCRC 80197 / JCM 7670 / NBRC 15755 / NCIMB 13165 / 161) TaxID=240015 RepID=C1F2C0_ACIC5|nr:MULTISPECIES: hypothetical protein [Acidobacterium]ACO31403.1 hypothetical protein ACP_0782 [Acidobacterium capsulatum ATCC 51196]HCT60035.1 hypothetical protein [Acidobacterium sp.]